MDGGEAYQLTTSKESITGFAWSKDGARIAFLAVDTLPKIDEAKRARRDDPQVFEGRLASVARVGRGRRREEGDRDRARRLHREGRARVVARRHSASRTRRRRRRCSARRAPMRTSSRSPIKRNETISRSPDVQSYAGVVARRTDARVHHRCRRSHTSRADSISDVQIGNNHLMLYDVASTSDQGRLRRQGRRVRRHAAVDAPTENAFCSRPASARTTRCTPTTSRAASCRASSTSCCSAASRSRATDARSRSRWTRRTRRPTSTSAIRRSRRRASSPTSIRRCATSRSAKRRSSRGRAPTARRSRAFS